MRSQKPPVKEAASPSPNLTNPIKVESRIVLVDVVVTDHKGKSIGNLPRDDFRIEEDGKPQTISAFEEHKQSALPVANLPPLPPHVYSNRQMVKAADAVNVLLIDTLNTYPWFQKDVCNQAVKFLGTLPPGVRLAIFALNDKQLRFIRGFTTDFSGLAGALDGQHPGEIPEASWLNPTPSRNAAEMNGLSTMIMMQASPAATGAVKQYLAQETGERKGARSDLTLEAFQHLARYLSGIPARKNVIWLADSFPISFVPENTVHTANHQGRVQQTSDMLTAAQVAIYPVSARGLIGDPSFEVTNLEGRDLLQQMRWDQIAMETLAQETGGRAFYNTNGLDAAMSKAVDEGSHYYTLAYAPTNAKNDGRYRRIKVNLADGKYRLAYRRGYYADQPAGQAQGRETAAPDDPLMPLVGFGMPNFDQITFQLEATLIYPQPQTGAPRAGLNTELKDPIARYAADLAVFPQGLGMETASDGMRHGRLEIMLMAYDRSGNIVNIAKRSTRFALTAQGFAAVQANGLPLHLEIDVPPGDIYLRTGVYDFGSGNVGTLGLSLNARASGASN
jgi:VWFA-related protein